MAVSTVALMRRFGVAGTGISAVLDHSGVSRRSVYLAFPGGKQEMVTEATRLSGDTITALIDRAAAEPDPLGSFVRMWKKVVADGDFEDGCPIVAAALGRNEAPAAADLAGDVFARWETTLAAALDPTHHDADALATTVVSAVEGAVIMCLAQRTTDPLDRVHAQLDRLLAAAAR